MLRFKQGSFKAELMYEVLMVDGMTMILEEFFFKSTTRKIRNFIKLSVNGSLKVNSLYLSALGFRQKGLFLDTF